MILISDTNEEGQYKMMYTKEEMKTNGFICGLIGAISGLVLGVVGLLVLVSTLNF